MRRLTPISLAALPALLLGSCGSVEEVPENGSLETEPMEISSELYPAAGAPATEGFGNNEWVYRSASREALYGPPESEAILSIACDNPGENELTVTRYVRAALGANGVLSFSGNNRMASVGVVSEPVTEGSGSVWQGNVSTDLAEFRQVFDGDSGTVAVELSTGSELTVPVSDAPLRAIDACAG